MSIKNILAQAMIISAMANTSLANMDLSMPNGKQKRYRKIYPNQFRNYGTKRFRF